MGEENMRITQTLGQISLLMEMVMNFAQFSDKKNV